MEKFNTKFFKMKYLILGDGKLGTEIRKQTNWDYISRKKNKFDFMNYLKYADLLNDYDTIINCIASTDTQLNEKQPHWDINYLGLMHLVGECNTLDKKLIHISSDYLYSGSNSNASEEDVPVHCNNWYSYTKLLGDA